MVNTSSHPITVDTVRLDTLAWNIETKTGWDFAPSARGSNIEIPAMDGEAWVPYKRDTVGRFALSMWVNGTDADGVAPVSGTAYAQYRKNLDALRLLFEKRHSLLHIVHDLDDAGIRECYAEVKGTWDPEMRTSPFGEFTIMFHIPAAFWQDTADVNFDSATGITNDLPYDTTAFTGATAIMRRLQMVVDGPVTNPRVHDLRSGAYVQLNFAVPNGEQWMIDTALHTSKTGAGIAFTQNGTTRMLEVVRSGAHSPTLFGLTPQHGVAPQVKLTGSGFGGNTRLRIRGRRQYR